MRRDGSSARAFEQRAGSLRHQARLGEQTDDGVERLGDGSVRRRWLQRAPGRREASWSADAAASSAARKYAAAIGFDGVPSALASPLSRHLEKGSRVGRRAVSLLRPPVLPVDGHVVEQLLRLHEQIVEPVDFRRGVGQPATPAHHRVKTVVMAGVEREEQRHDRVPRVGPDRAHQIAADLALEAAGAASRRCQSLIIT